MEAIAMRDICEEIKTGDKVEILPEYNYMMGTNVRIKDHYNLKKGEVVIQKIEKKPNKDEITIIKCKRSDIKIVEKV